MARPRIGIINRFDADKRRNYPLGLALERVGAEFVPIDVRDIVTSILTDESIAISLQPKQSPISTSDNLEVDGLVWRVSEASFRTYADLQHQLSLRYPIVNNWACASICASKWRTSADLAAAGIRVVPSILLLPGMKVPEFGDMETLIKPTEGAKGIGVRIAVAGTEPEISEPHVAQPLVNAGPRDQVRALVCQSSEVLAMVRLPGGSVSTSGSHWHPRLQINNIEAGGIPAPTNAEPIREIATAVARHLGGDLLGVDLVKWDGEWAVLEVNSSPGLDGIAQVTEVDCYRLAAEAVLSGLRRPASGGAT